MYAIFAFAKLQKATIGFVMSFFLYFPYRCAKWILFINSPSKHN